MAAKQGQGNEDFSFTVIMVFVLMLMGLAMFFMYKADLVLIPWKFLRAAELVVSLQFETLNKMWNYSFVEYGKAFDYTNDRVWMVYRWCGLPILIIGGFKLTQVKFLWSMEDTLSVGYQRFKWLRLVFDPATGLKITKKFPFISMGLKHTFPKVDFPSGVEPMVFFNNNRETLPEVLKTQLGPSIKIVNKKIEWADVFAKEVAYECYKRIPDKRPTPESKSWREMAWETCVKNHRFERTFAIGMLQAARDFGVYNVTADLLHLRLKAGSELKKKNLGLFSFWRALISFGGKTAYPEGAGIICHYYFEKALTDYLVTNPDDRQIAHYLRAQPWIKNAMDSFFELEQIIENSPDVIALRKAGLRK